MKEPTPAVTADDLGLTPDECGVLDLGSALSPWEVNQRLARDLGLRDLADLHSVVASGHRACAGGGLSRQQWLVLIDTVRTFVSPEDTELQTVTGYFFADFIVLLASAEAKVLSRTS